MDRDLNLIKCFVFAYICLNFINIKRKFEMKKSFILIVFSLIFCSQIFSQQITLRFQPEKGKVLNYLLLVDGTLTQSAMGMEQVVNSKTEGKYSYFIQNVSPKGDVDIIITVDTIKTSVKSQMSLLDTTFVIPLGLKFKQTLDKYGKIVSFETIEMKELQLPGGAERRIDKRNYSHPVVFPEKNVSLGDEWTFSYTDTNATEDGKVISKTTGKYKFNGVEEKNGVRCAKLGIDANISVSGQGVIQGMNYGLEGDGKSMGTLWIDLNRGTLVHMETDTEMEMAMGISGQVEMVMPMTQKFKTVVTLSK